MPHLVDPHRDIEEREEEEERELVRVAIARLNEQRRHPLVVSAVEIQMLWVCVPVEKAAGAL